MSKQKPALLLLGLAYLSFVSLGLPDGLLGVAWPSVRESFGLRLDALGSLLVMFTTGYLVSSFSSGWLLARVNVGSLLALSCSATAVSLAGYALAPHWWVMVTLAFLSGLGAGAIDAGLNTYAATHFSPQTVSWLHAFYGVGATLGPVIMTQVMASGHPWRLGYWMVGAAQLGLAACFGLSRSWWTDSKQSAARASPPSVPASATLRLRRVWLSLAVFFVYTGLEASAGAWAYSLFVGARAVPMLVAGTWVSIYYAGLTAGRFLSGVLANVVPVAVLLRFCIAGMALGAWLIGLQEAPGTSLAGLALLGLSSAPVFPSLIAATPNRLGPDHTTNGVGFQIAAASLGPALMPGFIGVLASHLGLEVVGPALLAGAVLLLALHEGLVAFSPEQSRWHAWSLGQSASQ